MHVKKGDVVKIISGKEKILPPAEVIAVFPAEGKVLVEGRNLVTRHIRGNSMLGTESHKEESEAKLNASNVLLWSAKLEKGVRTQVRYLGKGGSLHVSAAEARESLGEAAARVKKVRYCVASEETFDAID